MNGQAAPLPSSNGAPHGMLAHVRRLALNSGLYLVGTVFAQGLSLLLFPLYTRHLTPSAYGLLGVTATLTLFLKIVFGLSLANAVGRLYFEAESEEERRRLYGTVLLFLLGIPAFLAVATHVVGIAGGLNFLGDVPYTPYLQYVVTIAYLGIFMELPVAIYEARQEPRKVLMFTVANAILIAIGTVLLVVLLDQGVLGALRALLVASAVMAMVSIIVMIRASSFRFSRRWLTASLAFALPLIPHELGTWILFLSDRLVLTQLVSTSQLGLYTVAATVAGGANFLVLAMDRAFSPAMMLSLSEPEEQSRIPLIGTYWILGLSFGCTAVALFGADAILLLAPANFHAATGVLPWLVFGYVGLGVYSVLSQGTWFSLRTRMVPIVTLAAGGLNVGLNLVLVPRYGITGSAVATLVAFVTLALLQGVLSSRLHPIRWEYGRWGRILAASLGVLAFTRLLSTDNMAARIALEVFALAVGFPGILAVLGFWRPEDRTHTKATPADGRTRPGVCAKFVVGQWISKAPLPPVHTAVVEFGPQSRLALQDAGLVRALEDEVLE